MSKKWIPDLRQEIMDLAELFPYGVLQAETIPDDFLKIVKEEIQSLRTRITELEGENRRLKHDASENSVSNAKIIVGLRGKLKSYREALEKAPHSNTCGYWVHGENVPSIEKNCDCPKSILTTEGSHE